MGGVPCELIPRPPSFALHDQLPTPHQPAEMLFQGIPAASGQDNHILDGDPAVFAGVFQNLQGEFGQGGQHHMLPRHFFSRRFIC